MVLTRSRKSEKSLVQMVVPSEADWPQFPSVDPEPPDLVAAKEELAALRERKAALPQLLQEARHAGESTRPVIAEHDGLAGRIEATEQRMAELAIAYADEQIAALSEWLDEIAVFRGNVAHQFNLFDVHMNNISTMAGGIVQGLKEQAQNARSRMRDLDIPGFGPSSQ